MFMGSQAFLENLHLIHCRLTFKQYKLYVGDLFELGPEPWKMATLKELVEEEELSRRLT